MERHNIGLKSNIINLFGRRKSKTKKDTFKVTIKSTDGKKDAEFECNCLIIGATIESSKGRSIASFCGTPIEVVAAILAAKSAINSALKRHPELKPLLESAEMMEGKNESEDEE